MSGNSWCQMANLKSLIVLLCLFTASVEARRKAPPNGCPRGWGHYCDDETMCVKSMSEFTSSKQCIRRNGIPGVIACLENTIGSIEEQHQRFCIMDLENGGIGFAKSLKASMKRAIEKEELEEEEEDDDIELV